MLKCLVCFVTFGPMVGI